MNKHTREVRQALERENVALLSLTTTGGNHLRLVVSNGERTRKFFIASTPSDRRWTRNFLSHVRRFARGSC